MSGSALPAAASPDAAFITVQPTSSSSPVTNVGLLSVTIASSTPLTSLTVSLFHNSTDVLDLPMSDFVVPANDGNGTFGTWTLASPLTTSQLVLGDYGVYVSATDSGGDQISDIYSGPLTFLNEVTFSSFSSNGTTFSLDNPDVTFSGTASYIAVGASPVPFGSQSLDLTDNTSDKVPVTTNTDGSFAVTVPAKPESFWMRYAGSADTAASNSEPIQIAVTTFPVHISVAVKVRHADYGQADSVSGTVTYTDNGVAKALVGNVVSVYYVTSGNEQVTTATGVTGAGGNYTIPLATKDGGGTWYVSTTGTTFLPSAIASFAFTVAYPNSFSRFHASLSPFTVVSVSGCMRSGSRPIRIEYAAKPGGPWRLLGRITKTDFTRCGKNNWGVEFAGRFLARLPSAYYRARFTGSYSYQRAVSKDVHLAKLFTKITSFHVRPQRGALRRTITVSGRLWRQVRAAKWRPYAHRRVIVVFRYKKTWYRYRGEPKTNGAGRFSGRFKLYASSPMFARYNGDARHFFSQSKVIKVTVTRGAAWPALSERDLWVLAPVATAVLKGR